MLSLEECRKHVKANIPDNELEKFRNGLYEMGSRLLTALEPAEGREAEDEIEQ
jgi:hypothetical protein